MIARGRARRALIVLMTAAIGWLLSAAPASAHANLQSSDPAAGAVLDQGPSEVTLTFTEPPERSLSSIRVLDASGGSHETGPLHVDPDDRFTLHQAVETLAKGVYTVAWRAVSRADGHATAGSFAFGVQISPGQVPTGPTAGSVSSPPPSAAEIAGRWLLIVGLVALLGGAVVALVVFRAAPGRVRRLMWFGVAAALAGVVLLGLAQRAEAGASLWVFLGTTVGRAALWRAGAVVAAGVALFASRRATEARWAVWTVGAGAAGAMLAEVSAGHAAAARLWRWAVVGTQWAHFAAVGVWIGGLAALLAGIRSLEGEQRGRAIRRFSTAAGVCLGVVVGTGAIRAIGEVPSLHSLVSTGYGAVVLAKVCLLLVLASLGAVNRYRNVPRAGEQVSGLWRVSRGEIGVAVVALVATAVLTGLSPPKSSVAAAAPTPRVEATGSDFGTTVRVRLVVEPGTAGPNRFTATVTDFDSGQPVHAGRVALRFAPLDQTGVGESTLDLAPDSELGVYSGTGTNLSLNGRWTVTALIQQGTTSTEVQLHLATPCVVRAIPAAGQPTIYTTDLTGGGTVQMYLDPGKAGLNEVHFTFFDATGNELPIQGDPTILASTGQEPATTVEARRFSPGHFIGDATLGPGAWRFQITTSDASGGPYSACFEETVTG